MARTAEESATEGRTGGAKPGTIVTSDYLGSSEGEAAAGAGAGGSLGIGSLKEAVR